MPPEVAVSHSFRQRGVAVAHHVGLSHHRTQGAVHPQDPRPEEAGASLERDRDDGERDQDLIHEMIIFKD